jgi:uncharacterized protein
MGGSLLKRKILGDNAYMKFAREFRSALTVRRVEPGAIHVGNETYTENLILFRDKISPGWSPGESALLVESDIEWLIAEAPELILLGTGWRPAMPPRELVFALARKGIGLETMDTPAACRTFNILIGEDRDVAAVLLVEDGA